MAWPVDGAELYPATSNAGVAMKGRVAVMFDRDDFGDGAEVWVDAGNGSFSGIASAWMPISRLREFAGELSVYPLDAANLPRLEASHLDDPERGHVLVSLRLTDRRGGLAVYVSLATAVWPDDDSTRQSRVALEITTDYASLQRFARDLERLADGIMNEAVLESAQ
jgi:hypothetical protein